MDKEMKTLIPAWILSFVVLSSAFGAQVPLTQTQRDRLRFRLENLFNEMDLAIKNEKINRSDLGKQERDFEVLRVFEAIPLSENLNGLQAELVKLAEKQGLEAQNFKVVRRSKPKASPPRLVFSDDPRFKFTEDQLVEKIDFKLKIRGPKRDIETWKTSVQNEAPRLIEFDRVSYGRGYADIQAHAYRFRDVRFPKLVPRKSVELLPSWARKNQKVFAQTEPLLWELASRIEDLRPKALPLYSTREQFLLNDARISFFISKSLKK